MAADTDLNIAEGFFEALNTLAASLSPPLSVAWPNRAFSPEGEEPYLRASFLPARTLAGGLAADGDDVHTGIFQVSVFWPENKFLPGALAIAGEVVEHFAKFSFIERDGLMIKVDGKPWISPHVAEPKWISVPVNVPYFSAEA